MIIFIVELFALFFRLSIKFIIFFHWYYLSIICIILIIFWKIIRIIVIIVRSRSKVVNTDGTFLNAVFHVPLLYISLDQPKAHGLILTWQPTSCILHSSPAAPGLRNAWKYVAQVVGSCSGITNMDNRMFYQDILNVYDVKNWLSVVKLVQDLRASRFQPSCDTQLMSNVAWSINNIDIWHIDSPKSYSIYNCNNICRLQDNRKQYVKLE